MLPGKNPGEQLDSPKPMLAGIHKEDGCGERLIKFCSAAIFIGLSFGKSSGSHVLKRVKSTSSSWMSFGPLVDR